MKLQEHYERYNPFRLVNWRFERVIQMADRQPVPGRPTKRDDEYVRRARTFLLKWRAAAPEDRRELFFDEPGLYYAMELHEKEAEKGENVLYLQARLLSGMSTETICKSGSYHPDAVDWYERLFFNVRPYLWQRDWVQSQILVPAMVHNFGLSTNEQGSGDNEESHNTSWHQQTINKPFMDASLKMFAYHAGPIMCEYLIAGFQQGKTVDSVERIQEYLDDSFSQTIRRRSAQAAQTFEINRFNVLELFQVHTAIIQLSKSEDSLEQTRTVIESHVGALLKELPWSVGQEARKDFEGTDVGRYDEGAAELRDGELLLVAAGEKAKARLPDQLELLALPPPRKKDDVKETVNAAK